MFVKKLVDKATKKAGESSIHGLKVEDVNPHLAFHYGVPAGASQMAYDLIQNILAIATNDGRIKLFGMDNTQALLQSEAPIPSKFLQFIENHGILLNINVQNHIEVWDIDTKELCYVHISSEEITAYAVMQQSLYMYVGNCHGDIFLLKLVTEEKKLVSVQYTIPFRESYGKMNEVCDDNAVIGILPQPMAESKRVLILFKDGVISLWGLQESKVVSVTGGITQISSHQEPKKAVAACWACPYGSKLVVGYSNGEIFIWAIPTLFSEVNKKESHSALNIPLAKLNLGYKTDKIPIISLRWVSGDGRASHLYVNGYSDNGSHSFQVVVLNETSESRTIKLVLPLTETCLAMEIVSCFSDRTKHKQTSLLLLSKSNQLHIYNDSQIEHYLSQCQSKSSPSLPNHFVLKPPFNDSGITIAKLYTSYSVESNIMNEEQLMLLKKYSNLFLVDKRDTNHSSSNFSGFAKTTRYLCITGHQDGGINFWDASCPLLFPILSIKQQTEDSNAPISTPVTALHFDLSSQTLVTGDQNGLARIIKFKKDQHASDNMFSFLQAKPGGNYTTRSVKVKGVIQCISVNPESNHLAMGTDKGFIFVFEMEGTNILYQKQFPSQLYPGINSLQFENCSHNGYAKNILLIGMQDSSFLAIEEDNGTELNASAVHTKKPSRALLMQIVGASSDGVYTSGSQLLFCSENAVRIYSLSHAMQGIKKVNSKKKLSGNCCYASIVFGPSSDVGLILVFESGKVEIRSLPDLSLLKEVSVRGFPYSTLKSSAHSSSVICASPQGELVIVNGDQEILFFSVLVQQGTYRNLKGINQVYKHNNVYVEGGSPTAINAHKEKKKGIFSMVRDLTGNKSKHGQDTDTEESRASTAEELSALFSTANFSLDYVNKHTVENEEDIELDIDDIDVEDTKEKPKEWNFSVLNKQKLSKKFQAIKGKLKTKTDEKLNSSNNGNEDDKAVGGIDQIKKKYGYGMNNEFSAAKAAESKLSDNVRKLQGINDKTSEMKDTAQSFSSLAKELLRTTQKDKKSS
ncbi:uncharacterized protein A4U43_C10F2390 [Asparagus officinalis]|uniref:Lethal giant larvae (Lgl)-like C-terminal domain-containing protein n=1 Tax=Asparagus officinalis TaxID=4686 RepID=A0A5P1E0C4_ASPOF|nr:uncharacterized protein LOC109825019 isoform X2 [Asparagus officinalis]ONK55928.1 uncharacterized protein A4U43_C10F2390 [Asparagus officinalis]